MSMQSWAEKEVEIACKREREASDVKDDDWDYGCACYESALKAYKSLVGDGHSGFSIGMTKHILNRLIEGKPLVPIEDTDDVWIDVDRNDREGYVCYQCKRMSALFKYVYHDGRVKYRDINSYYCIDINNHSTYTTGLVSRLMDEMFPISMPYMPDSPIKVYCEDFLTDRKNGDIIYPTLRRDMTGFEYDTKGIFYAVKSDGEIIEINRFFKEYDCESGWEEIDAKEYMERKMVRIDD